MQVSRRSTVRPTRAFRWLVAAVAAGVLPTLIAAGPRANPGTSAVPGATYRLQLTTRLPAFMGGAAGGSAPGGPVVIARATSAGTKARFEFTSIDPLPPGMTLNDYLLLSDSASQLVNPVARTYTDASGIMGAFGIGGAMGGRGGRGMPGAGGGRPGGAGAGGGAAAPGPAGLLNGFQVRDVHVDLRPMGAGEVMDGRPTRHYMLMIEYRAMMGGQPQPMRMAVEMWTADLPVKIVNPFATLVPADYDPNGTTVELNAKMSAALKKVEGTTVKMITTISLTDLINAMSGGGGGGGGRGDLSALLGGQPLEITQTVTVSAVRAADVDPATLAVPAGFTKR
jgi:hypothetical protein